MNNNTVFSIVAASWPEMTDIINSVHNLHNTLNMAESVIVNTITRCLKSQNARTA